VDVYYNGSKLAPSEFTATSGTSIVLATACQAGDIVDVVAYVTGVTGSSGTSGTSGSSATSGSSGSSGTSASSGSSGTSASSGSSGTSASSGSSGTSGSSATSGTSGSSGTTGTSGSAGTSGAGTISGTVNYVAKFTGATTIGNSAISDNGSLISVGLASVFSSYVDGFGLRATSSSAFGGTGVGVEIGYSGGLGYVQAYNRSTSAYQPMKVDGSTVSLQISGVEKLGIASTGAATFSSSVTAGGSGNEFVYKAASSSIGVVGNWVGYLYGFNTSSYNKGATIFESTDGNGRGKFHIALNNDANSTNVSIADAKLTILPSGAATFSSSVTAVNTIVSSGASGGYALFNYGANVVSRSWQIASDGYNYGDFVINQSTTQTGSTYATKFIINASGNVGIGTVSPSTFSANYIALNINAPAGYGSGTIFKINNVAETNFYAESGITTLNIAGVYAITGSFGTAFRVTSGGNVLIGTTTDSGQKLQVNGNIAINKGAGNTAIFDSSGTVLSLATGGTVDFAVFSGMLMVTNFNTGAFQIFVCGGGSTASVYLLGGAIGTFAYNIGINGYTFTSSAATATFNFTAFRTRPNA
jgi:hypothetical protein